MQFSDLHALQIQLGLTPNVGSVPRAHGSLKFNRKENSLIVPLDQQSKMLASFGDDRLKLLDRFDLRSTHGQAERFDLLSRIKHHRFPGGALMRTPALVPGTLYYRLLDLL